MEPPTKLPTEPPTQSLSESHTEPHTEPTIEPLAELPTGPSEEGIARIRQWIYDVHSIPSPGQSLSSGTKTSSVIVPQQLLKGPVPEGDELFPKRPEWLRNPVDAKGIAPTHSKYDPHTLYIPPHKLAAMDINMKTYWEVKKERWDTIVFFRPKGPYKKWKLFDKDAVVGAGILQSNAKIRPDMYELEVGFDEAIYSITKLFLENGYSEVTHIYRHTKGGHQSNRDFRSSTVQTFTIGTLLDSLLLGSDNPVYCMAVSEAICEPNHYFGVVVFHAATASFQLSEFVDNSALEKMQAVLTRVQPQEFLTEAGKNLSPKARHLFTTRLERHVLWKKGGDHKQPETAVSELLEADYFNLESLPEALETVFDKIEQGTGWAVAMSAFGILHQHLKDVGIAEQIIRNATFTLDDPRQNNRHAILYQNTLVELAVLPPTDKLRDHSPSILGMLDKCVTAAGHMLMRKWLLYPLLESDSINRRLDAIDVFIGDRKSSGALSGLLRELPNLRYLITRICMHQCNALNFRTAIVAFRQLDDRVRPILYRLSVRAPLLHELHSRWPELGNALTEAVKGLEDKNGSLEQDNISDSILLPVPGVMKEYDEASKTLVDYNQSQPDVLLQQAEHAVGKAAQATIYSSGSSDNGPGEWCVELNHRTTPPLDWDVVKRTNNKIQYRNAAVIQANAKRSALWAAVDMAQRAAANQFYDQFSTYKSVWIDAVDISAQLDCLLSLAAVSRSMGDPKCRPNITGTSTSPAEIVLKDVRHPMLPGRAKDGFVPNDIHLGGNRPPMILLTGANAAGKSTIMRTTGVALILAQIGCYVPCSAATITPVDRIMVRFGVEDRLFAGQSTFFIETTETQSILASATKRSLVLLDEIGRGTSSTDGEALAEAVLHHLATQIGCCGFFATHFINLASAVGKNHRIQPMRMAVEVTENNVRFLYKLESGTAETSYGLQCARWCGVPDSILLSAQEAANRLRLQYHNERQMQQQETSSHGITLGMQSDIAWIYASNRATRVDDNTVANLLETASSLEHEVDTAST